MKPKSRTKVAPRKRPKKHTYITIAGREVVNEYFDVGLEAAKECIKEGEPGEIRYTKMTKEQYKHYKKGVEDAWGWENYHVEPV